MSASVTCRVRRVGRTASRACTKPLAVNPGVDMRPASCGETEPPLGTLPTRGGVFTPGSGMSPGIGISPGFGIADALGAADAVADAADAPDGEDCGKSPLGSGGLTSPTNPTGPMVESSREFDAVPHAEAAPATTSAPTATPSAGLTMDRRTVVALRFGENGSLIRTRLAHSLPATADDRG